MAKFLLILVIVAVYIHLCNSGKGNEEKEGKGILKVYFFKTN